MTKFASFSRSNLPALRAELAAVLEKYGVAANLEFAVGNMKFSAADVEIKLTAKIVGAKCKTDVMLESQCRMMGLKLINSAGDKLVGYNSRAYKMQFIFESAEDGKRYKTSADNAKRRFSA